MFKQSRRRARRLSPVLMATLVAVAAITAACGGNRTAEPAQSGSDGTPQAGGTLRVVRAESFDGWDPDKSSAYVSYQTTQAVIEPMVRFGADGKSLEPGIADSWTYDEKAMAWTFELRSGVTFSDGTPLTSADVVFSATSWSEGPNFGILYSGIEKVEAPSPDTVVITMLAPDTTIPVLMSWSSSGIVPVDYGGKSREDFFRDPIGAGAFVVQDWSPGGKTTLVANDNYYQPDRPYLDGIEIDVVADANERALIVESGQADVSEYVSATSAKQYADNLVDLPASQVEHLSLNVTRAPFDDPEVRAAVASAIDYEGIVAGAFQGYGSAPDGILPPNLGNAASPSTPGGVTDVEKAKALLAGSSNPNPEPVELVYDSGQPADELVAQIVQANLKEIGLDSNLVGLETGAFLDRAYGLDADVVIWSYGAISPDMIDPLGWLLGTTWLFTGQDTAKLGEQYAAYSSAATDAEKQAIVVQVQDEAAETNAAIAVSHGQVLHAARPNVNGFAPAPWGLYYWDPIWLDQ